VHIIWPPLIVGPIVIAAGIALIIYRVKIADNETQNAWSTRLAWHGARRPWMVVLTAIWFTLLGASAILGSLGLN
jgi:hypothetical protein